MRLMFLFITPGTQVSQLLSFVKFFASEEEDFARPRQKSIRNDDSCPASQKIFASRLRVVSFFEKTEWKKGGPGGARHLVLCNNFGGASHSSAFVKFLG